MKYLSIILIAMAFASCGKADGGEGADGRTANFPALREKVTSLPPKDKLWIFVLAGQSNMAGRGFVEPDDTLSDDRIISLGAGNEWFYAKEPLHFYEPERTGLDCGLSFARELLRHIPDDVTIGLIPCAVGGSAISQWNTDEVYRGVKLLTNYSDRVAAARGQGVIRGILWHQGESDAHSDRIPKYRDEMESLFSKFRALAGNDSLPILVGELGSFRQPAEVQLRCDSINAIIHEGARADRHRFVISTKDLQHKGDTLHFDSPSQREMGKRFAQTYAREVLHADGGELQRQTQRQMQ